MNAIEWYGWKFKFRNFKFSNRFVEFFFLFGSLLRFRKFKLRYRFGWQKTFQVNVQPYLTIWIWLEHAYFCCELVACGTWSHGPLQEVHNLQSHVTSIKQPKSKQRERNKEWYHGVTFINKVKEHIIILLVGKELIILCQNSIWCNKTIYDSQSSSQINIARILM